MVYYVYLAKNSQAVIYVGQTTNLSKRINRHNSKQGGKFTSDNQNTFEIVYYEKYLTRKEAMNREMQIKKWSRAKKEALIEKNFNKLHQLSKKRGE